MGRWACRREALERHIAYDIGARWMTLRIAEALGAPAVLSTFSRLLIDPNRGADDPTLVMRYSDGAIVPGNARIGEDEIDRRMRAYWQPYRDAVQATTEAMLAHGRPPAIVSIHSFTDAGAGSSGPGRSACCTTATTGWREPFLRALEAGRFGRA